MRRPLRGFPRLRWMVAGSMLAAVVSLGAVAPPASAQTRNPAGGHRLTIQVVPPISGVAFTLDGRRFWSDSSGWASISTPAGGSHRLTVGAARASHDVRYQFQRWTGDQGLEDFNATRDIVFHGSVTRLVAGFETRSLIGWRFVDQRGEPIPTEVAKAVTLKDDSGSRYQLAGGGPHWLPARRIVRENSGRVSARLLTYSVESVIVDGTSVVFRSQQRFRPTPGASWTIRLRFHEMSFKVEDAVFRFAIGSALDIRYPGGRLRRLPLDHGVAHSGRVGDGDYEVKVVGPGFSSWVPVSLSRTQQVTMVFVSWLDIALAGLVLALITVGLPLLGGRLRPFRRRRPPPADDQQAGAAAPGTLVSNAFEPDVRQGAEQ
jgi:hypothetical protein